LAKQVSIPAEPGADTGMVNSFSVLKIVFKPSLVSCDKVVVCINGVFGMRMQENITRFGGVAVVVEDDWGTAVSLDKVEQTLKDNADAKILAFNSL
jgi:aspartate aminotransferase-like enzyme